MTRPLLALGLLVAGWTMIGIPAYATFGARVTADEPQYLLSALSIGQDGDLDIANQLAAEAYRPFHAVDLDPQTVPLDASGRQVSPHDPLLPAVLAGPMRIGGWIAAKATMAALAAAVAMITAWIAMRRFGVMPWIAIGVTAAFACTAPLSTYATQIYPEIPAALGVVIAVAALTSALSRRHLVVAVAAIVALPWLSVKYAPLAACLTLLLLWKISRRGRCVAVVGGAIALAGAGYLAAHRAIYGGWTAYATGDHFATAGELSVVGESPNYLGRGRRLIGLLVDEGFGIAAWMTGWLAAPFALGAWVRRRPPDWLVVVAPLAVGWCVATFVALTMHGWWFPGRQVVVVLPLAVVMIAAAAQRSLALRWFIGVTAAIGAATWLRLTVDAVTRRRTLIVEFDQADNPWLRLWRAVLPDGRSVTSLDDLLTAGWIAIVVALVAVGWWRFDAKNPRHRLASHIANSVGSPNTPR